LAHGAKDIAASAGIACWNSSGAADGYRERFALDAGGYEVTGSSPKTSAFYLA
jgi:hypothetical protein